MQALPPSSTEHQPSFSGGTVLQGLKVFGFDTYHLHKRKSRTKITTKSPATKYSKIVFTVILNLQGIGFTIKNLRIYILSNNSCFS